MKKPPSAVVRLNGGEWTIDFVRRSDMPKKTWGDFDAKRRHIRVRYDLSEKNFLDTLLHELIHAEATFADEEWVDPAATRISAAILATGTFTRTPQ